MTHKQNYEDYQVLGSGHTGSRGVVNKNILLGSIFSGYLLIWYTVLAVGYFEDVEKLEQID